MIASLPQLKQLDGLKIENSERIVALQVYSSLINFLYHHLSIQRKREVEGRVAREEEGYRVERQRQREEHERQKARREEVEATMEEDDVLEKRKRFFEERSSHCPETKLEMQEVVKEAKSVNTKDKIKRQKEVLIHGQCVNFLQASLGTNRNGQQTGDGGDPAGEGARGAGGEA